jgi:thiamine pyrophosphate-dependent acetolactate synthase large subunit-like protein
MVGFHGQGVFEMNVKELIELLQKQPPDAKVIVNDNNGGNVHDVDSVSFFNYPGDGPEVVIQVNCD